jgi:hypothetical protein
MPALDLVTVCLPVWDTVSAIGISLLRVICVYRSA